MQNCPAPIVKEPTACVAMSAPRASAAARVTNTGLTLPSSPKNGIGTGRETARSKSARPPAVEPVKAPARTPGSTSASRPASSPTSSVKRSSGAPASASARRTTSAVATERRRWPGWALSSTGHPAASAEAVSPPATLNAKGKLPAPKTTTGPSGTIVRRRSGRGAPIGQSGSAWSTRTSR